jgi:hypothetical protein
MSKLRYGFALLVIGHTPFAVALEADETVRNRLSGLAVEVGLEYERGNYGTADTTQSWRLPVSLLYSTDDVTVGITLPYVTANSTGSIVLSSRGGGHNMSTRVSSTAQSVSGMGDVKVYATYNLPAAEDSNYQSHLTGRIKFATADENKGLGSGEQDYAVEFGIARTLEKQTYFGSLGYEFVGDSATINYDNVLYGEAGLKYEFNDTYSAGAALDYSQANITTLNNYFALSGFMNYEMDKKRDLFLYLLLGLSDSAPDSGAGVSLRYSF